MMLLASCNSNQEKEQSQSHKENKDLVFEVMEIPAGVGSFYPRLASSNNNGALLISWYSKGEEDTTRLYTASYDASAWSEPELVAKGDNWFVNWADFPNLSQFGEKSKAISYLQKSGDDLYAYDVHLKLYEPSSGNWEQSLVPHSDATQTEHGFVSMAPMQDNTLGLIWLDGRKYESADHSHEDHGAGEMTLRFAQIGEDAAVLEEQELDGRTCDCCQTAMAASSSGVIAVYRDRSEQDVRDISYVRYEDGRWTSPQRLHADEWTIRGCPVNGPAIAAEKEEVVVAWYTAAEKISKVQLIRSGDEGKTWAEPIVIDDQNPIGRVGVCLLPDKSAMVSWMAEGGNLNVKRVNAAGEILGGTTVAKVQGSRSSGFPQIEYNNQTIYLAWTDIGEQKEVKMAKAAL
jgi:hypothetical protein